GAMPADADEHLWETGLRHLGKIDDLGDMRQVIAGEGDDVRPPAFEHPEVGAAVFDLQINQLNLVSRLPRRLGDEFKADRLEPQKELRVKKHPGKDTQKPHGNPPSNPPGCLLNDLDRRGVAWRKLPCFFAWHTAA